MKSVEKRDHYHHGALRQALIESGLSEIERVGLENLSLRSIAEQLGVSKTAPFRHFPSKRALLSVLAAEGFRELADALEQAEGRAGAPEAGREWARGRGGEPNDHPPDSSGRGGSRSDGDRAAPRGGPRRESDRAHLGPDRLQDQLVALGRAYIGFALERPALYRLMFSRLGYTLESDSCKINAGRAFGVLIRSVEARTAIGWRRPEDTEALTVSVWALVHGWAGLLIDDLVPKEVPNIEKRWVEMLATLLE